MLGEAAAGKKGIANHILTSAQRGELALPALPAAIQRLLHAIQDEDRADLGEISEMMLGDAAITTSLLRVANSAAFAGFGKAPDLSQAIQRLGLRQVGTLVVSIAHKNHFDSSNPRRLELLRSLWDYAMVSAIAVRTLAGGRPADATQAYLAGLLHDAGKLVVLKGIDDFERRTGDVHFSTMDVEELMEALHTVLGFSTLRAWNIADRICRVALHHHDSAVPDEDRLLVAIQAADQIARKLCGHRDSDRELDLARTAAIQRLDLSEGDLAGLIATIETEVARARSLID